MGVLQEFERRLEGAVEGFFARIFRSGVQPIELARAVRRYGEDRQHVTADGVVVPNVYRLSVGPKDQERLAGFGTSLPRELAEVVVRTASDRGWILKGPARVRIEVDPEVKLGRFRLTGRVESVEDARRSPEPQVWSAPVNAPADNPHGTAGPSAGERDPQQPERAGPGSSGAADPRSAMERTQVISSIPEATLNLVIRSGASAGTSVPVRGSRLTAGRSSGCDVTIEDTTVSREHAAFVRRGESWWVVDLGSTNGTKVNGNRAAEHQIQPGDRIQLGDVVVELVGH